MNKTCCFPLQTVFLHFSFLNMLQDLQVRKFKFYYLFSYISHPLLHQKSIYSITYTTYLEILEKSGNQEIGQISQGISIYFPKSQKARELDKLSLCSPRKFDHCTARKENLLWFGMFHT